MLVCIVGFLTELIKAYGAKGVQVEELFPLTNQVLPYPIHGLLLYHNDSEVMTGLKVITDKVYFPKWLYKCSWTIHGILSLLLNINESKAGGIIKQFKETTRALTPLVLTFSLKHSKKVVH